MNDTDERTEGEAQRIVEEGSGIEQRIEALVREGMKAGELSVSRLRSLFLEVLSGASRALEKVAPTERSERVEQVVRGLEGGLENAINTVMLSIQEATGEGKKFAQEDLSRFVTELSSLGTDLRKGITKLGSSSGRLLESEWQRYLEHVDRAAERLGPLVGEMVMLMMTNPGGVAKTAAGAITDLFGSALRGVEAGLRGKEDAKNQK